MNIIITGVAGFIGSNFAHHIAGKYPDYTIIGIDKLSTYSCRENVADLERNGRLIFLQADIAEGEAMADVYHRYKPEAVVNFAAESHNDRGILNPTEFVRSNVLGALNLLELSRTICGVRRHLQVSTIEVYGEQGGEVPYFDEGSPLNAKTPYSASKAAADILVRAYMQTYPELDVCITHCANNYGPYQFPEKLIPLAVSNLLRGRKVQVYGDGMQKRDWLHVLDHCRGIDLVLHRDRFSISKTAATAPAELPIFDFSARQEMTNLDLIKIICNELNLDFHESVDFVTDRPNHDRRYLINPGKAETVLGFKPTIALEEGIRATVKWYVENRQWWEAIVERTGNLEINWATHASQKHAEGANTSSL